MTVPESGEKLVVKGILTRTTYLILPLGEAPRIADFRLKSKSKSVRRTLGCKPQYHKRPHAEKLNMALANTMIYSIAKALSQETINNSESSQYRPWQDQQAPSHWPFPF